MHWKPLPLLFSLSAILLLFAFVTRTPAKTEFESAKQILVMRKIANEILRYTGNSSSAILPVERLSPTAFRIPFATSFRFMPDSLVAIIGRVMKSQHQPEHYLVNVQDCNTRQVIFGYMIAGTEQNTLVPCLGREQPKLRYCIDIRYPENEWGTEKLLYLLAAGLLVTGIGLAAWKRLNRHKQPAEPSTPVAGLASAPFLNPGPGLTPASEKLQIPIGQYQFLMEEQLLMHQGISTQLTGKEAGILQILASQIGETIERQHLQKLWEDEGVIVGRSLDVFISKLRKKLEKDPAVKITNIHGKGYKLEILETQ